ncbi:MAG: AAA family ATPase [Deltaproteobacteria bacterium]|nr:AAA family ATPase [Deltaproteobacteria bacterium]
MSRVDARSLVSGWLDGRAVVEGNRVALRPRRAAPFAEKLQRAYAWITERAIHTPYADLELGPSTNLGKGNGFVEVTKGPSYSSFILLPLLNLVVRRRLVFVGGTGRGKTSVATLMGILAGYPPEQIRRAIQHGHPQLTNADLLGSPLPSALVRAERSDDVHVSWRSWIGMRVKIIDEYNRIPTKTQSALLSLMAEGYAEMYEQLVEAGRAAWYLTANDDLGGGTFPVIEALRDRIDAVVCSTPFHASFLGSLAARLDAGIDQPVVPRDLVFTELELDQADTEIRAIPIPADVLELLGFFLSQLEFCRRASLRIEGMTKDTLHLAGRRVAHVCNEDCPLDKLANLCTQTENGSSARAYQALLHFAKALAYFRGQQAVSTAEVRAILPFVLLERLRPNESSAFFEREEHKTYLLDRVGWIRQLFDRAVAQHAAHRGVHESVTKLVAELDPGMDELSSPELQLRLSLIEQKIEAIVLKNELNGPVHQDLVALKSLHARCTRASNKQRGRA